MPTGIILWPVSHSPMDGLRSDQENQQRYGSVAITALESLDMRCIGGPLFTLLLLPVATVAADATPASLARLKAVGREGVGSATAARAWKDVVQQGPAVLPAILQTMEDADPPSANWLRTAGDTIVERALSTGKPLPLEALERFIGQAQQNGAARRLAYEWLCRVDPKTPERLLPGMLGDPSPELRRDAVAAVLKQARSVLDKGDQGAARIAYRRALTGACDKDQVDLIVKELDKLGEKIDVAAHFGFVRRWAVIAPFENHDSVGFKIAYPPEERVEQKAVYQGKDGKETRWTAVSTTDPYGKVDLNKALVKQQGVIAYAFAIIDSPKEQAIQVRAGSMNALKIFLNGKEVFHREEYHHGAEMDQYVANGALRAGRNELLVKVCQNEQKEEWAQSWGFQVRLCDAVGSAVPFTQLAMKVGKTPGAE